MDVDPGYKFIEKIRSGVQWYMMESKDIISSICFKLKNEKVNVSCGERANKFQAFCLKIFSGVVKIDF